MGKNLILIKSVLWLIAVVLCIRFRRRSLIVVILVVSIY